MLLRIKNLTKAFGSKTLLQNSDLIIHPNERIALLGQNGTGKSTFLKCITGEEDYEGIIELAPKTKLSSMAQEREFKEENNNFISYLLDKKEKTTKKREAVEAKLGDSEIYTNPDKYSKILSEYEVLCASTTDNIEEVGIKKILKDLKFELEDYDKPIRTLSGGQRTKLRLAESLSKKAALYILDEPTNHLDLATRAWLERYLIRLDATLLIISHDRYFVNKLVKRVLEIQDQKLVSYTGNYTNYLGQRAKYIEILQLNFDNNEREKSRLTASMKEKREWMKKAKSKKLKVQIDHLQKRIDDLPKLNNPKEFETYFDLEFKEAEITPSIIFEGIKLSKSFGTNQVLDSVSFEIRRGDRIALIGANGCGKSTLLKILNSGDDALNEGHNLKIGYFDQEFKDMNPKSKIINYLDNHFGPEHELISFLIKLGFPRDKMQNKISTLSGGEKARLSFARLMLGKYNVLLLDEPTNNIDLELLENAMKQFKGTIVFVSHDRLFMDKLATRMFLIENKKIKVLDGKYSDSF